MKITLAFQHTLPKEHSVRNTIETNLIKLGTNSKYFHVETIIQDKWISANPSYDGVYIRDLKPLNTNLYDYVEINVGRQTQKRINEVMTFLESIEGSGYDWMGIFFLILKINNDDSGKWFCSEVSAEVIKQFNKDILHLSSNQYSPGDLFRAVKVYNEL